MRSALVFSESNSIEKKFPPWLESTQENHHLVYLLHYSKFSQNCWAEDVSLRCWIGIFRNIANILWGGAIFPNASWETKLELIFFSPYLEGFPKTIFDFWELPEIDHLYDANINDIRDAVKMKKIGLFRFSKKSNFGISGW